MTAEKVMDALIKVYADQEGIDIKYHYEQKKDDTEKEQEAAGQQA